VGGDEVVDDWSADRPWFLTGGPRLIGRHFTAGVRRLAFTGHGDLVSSGFDGSLIRWRAPTFADPVQFVNPLGGGAEGILAVGNGEIVTSGDDGSSACGM
jgi:hypothetical protein